MSNFLNMSDALWKIAPDWAKYLAMDENGDWSFFENEPTYETKNIVGVYKKYWISDSGRRQYIIDPHSKYSLTSRPK